MIVDSSAIVAIVLAESAAGALLRVMADASGLKVGAPTLVETGMVLTSRLGPEGRTLLARFQQQLELEVIAFGDQQRGRPRRAHRLSYDGLDRGERLVVWVQAQINPTTIGREDTSVELDDETLELARLDRTVTVLP